MAANTHNHEWVELGRGWRGSGVAAESFITIVYRCDNCESYKHIERHTTLEESDILKGLHHNLILDFTT